MKTGLKLVTLLTFFLFSAVILISMVFLKPQRYGDGNEYYLMLVSLQNHFAPDLQEKEVLTVYRGEFNVFGEKADPKWGYFQGRGGKWYSQHFWAYSLVNIPTSLALELFRKNPAKTLQITNALLFVLLLAAITFYSRFEDGQKLLFMMLLFFSPALWFIHWTHPEVFMFSLVTLSLIFLRSNHFGLALTSAIIASFQNQVLVLFVLFLTVRAVFYFKLNPRAILGYGTLSTLVFAPNVFFLIVFGMFTPLHNAASVTNISTFRVFELLFDLNMGLFPYLPLTLLLFLGIVFYNLFKKRTFSDEAQFFLLILALLTLCASTDNWNHGTSGPARYVIWILPLLFYIITDNSVTLMKSAATKIILGSALLMQVYLVISGGFLIRGEDYLKHTAAAEFVLNHFPRLYNPSFEIFCERTMHRESDCVNPTIYKHDGKCKKALVNCEGLTALKSVCGESNQNFQTYCQSHYGDWFYVNY
jgi:hypothetical protein